MVLRPRKTARPNRPKTSEATAKGNIVSTTCFLDNFALASIRHAVLYGAKARNGMRTTLPKMSTDAIAVPQHNLLFYLALTLLTSPKMVAFGEVSDVS
jgi:hypothetical protein